GSRQKRWAARTCGAAIGTLTGASRAALAGGAGLAALAAVLVVGLEVDTERAVGTRALGLRRDARHGADAGPVADLAGGAGGPARTAVGRIGEEVGAV